MSEAGSERIGQPHKSRKGTNEERLVAVIILSLETLGSITNRAPEAEGLAIAVVDTFGKKG